MHGRATKGTGAAARIVCGVAAALAGMALPGGAAAATRYAEPAGNGPEASCPLADPCDLTTAVEGPSLDDGDEVVVLPGVHQLPPDDPADSNIGVNPLEVERPMQVRGASGTLPTIVADSGPVYVDDPAAVISDVRVQGGLGLQTGMAERVTVHQAEPGFYACFFDKYSLVVEPGPVIRDSVCWNDDGAAGSGAGIGVAVGLGSPGNPRSLSARLVNVTAVGSSAGVSVATREGSSAAVEAKNVIAIGTEGEDVRASTLGSPGAAGVAASLSLANSNYETARGSGAGASVTAAGSVSNQTERPILASPLSGDFRQMVGSPTIDAGGPDGLLGSLDFEREPRVQGPAPDIGADEGALTTAFTLSARARATLRRLGVVARCALPSCGLRAGGLIVFKQSRKGRSAARGRAGGPRTKQLRLKPKRADLASGEKRKLRLKLSARSRRSAKRLLADGAKATARVTVDTGEGGVSKTARIRVVR